MYRFKQLEDIKSEKDPLEIDPKDLQCTGNIEIVIDDSDEETQNADIQDTESQEVTDNAFTEDDAIIISVEDDGGFEYDVKSEIDIDEYDIENQDVFEKHPKTKRKSTAKKGSQGGSGIKVKSVESLKPSNNRSKSRKRGKSHDFNEPEYLPSKKGFAVPKGNPCFVPGCKLPEKGNVYFFHPPRNVKLFQLWNMFINKKGKTLSSGSVVCQQHFHPHDILEISKDVLAALPHINVTDGEKYVLKREAIPCIDCHEQCAVINCNMKNLPMHQFPIIDKSAYNQWMERTGNPTLKTLDVMQLMRHRICDAHFQPVNFNQFRELKPGTVPTKHLPGGYKHKTSKQYRSVLDQLKLPKPGLQGCCIFSKCITQSLKKNIIPLPGEHVRLAQWLYSAGKSHLVKNDLEWTMEAVKKVYPTPMGVCMLHFTSEDFIDANLNRLSLMAVPKKDGKQLDYKNFGLTLSEMEQDTNAASTNTTDINAKIATALETMVQSQPLTPLLTHPAGNNVFLLVPGTPGLPGLPQEILPNPVALLSNGNLMSLGVNQTASGSKVRPIMPKPTGDMAPVIVSDGNHPQQIIFVPQQGTPFQINVAPQENSDELKETQQINATPEKINVSSSSSPKTLFNTVKLPRKPCIYKGCNERTCADNPLYNFPVDKERRKAWLEACGVFSDIDSDNRMLQVCKKHFSSDMFNLSSGLLKPDAIPIRCLPEWMSEPSALDDKVLAGSCTTFDNKSDRNKNKKRILSRPELSSTFPATLSKRFRSNTPCAVPQCTASYMRHTYKWYRHRFPNPTTELERFNAWLELANPRLSKLHSENEIYENYVVCERHFESKFYLNDASELQLSKVTVPTLAIPGDITKFKETSEFYKSEVEPYLKSLDVPSVELVDMESSPVTENEKTRCVLQKDRIVFPGLRSYLRFKKETEDDHLPYAVYKLNKTDEANYNMMKTLENWENINIHTAIIIDDNDDCERAVLQKILESRQTKSIENVE